MAVVVVPVAEEAVGEGLEGVVEYSAEEVARVAELHRRPSATILRLALMRGISLTS